MSQLLTNAELDEISRVGLDRDVGVDRVIAELRALREFMRSEATRNHDGYTLAELHPELVPPQ